MNAPATNISVAWLASAPTQAVHTRATVEPASLAMVSHALVSERSSRFIFTTNVSIILITVRFIPPISSKIIHQRIVNKELPSACLPLYVMNVLSAKALYTVMLQI